MANIVFNVAKGRAVELYKRVQTADPAGCRLILVPIESTGLEADSALIDAASLAAALAGSTNEQTSMGRKVLADVDLAALPAPDHVNDRYDISIPTVTWAAATGNAVAKVIVAYDPDGAAGTDADIVPLTMFDFAQTPSGADITLAGGIFFRAG